MKGLLYVSIVLLLFTACKQQPENTTPTSEQTDRVTKAGREVSARLLENLGGQLKAALQAGGPVSAMQACQQVAPLTSVAIGEAYQGVSVRRTTLQPRNRENTPDAIDMKVLKRLQTMAELPEEHIEWIDGSARYYKPLVIQEVCLRCHGNKETFSPDLVNAIEMLYPEDQAVGYSLGELRGVIRVDIESID